jgi:pyrimidine-specific ribonucleoside hydrolase
MKRLTVILLLATMCCGQVLAHSGKPKYHVIIDTDGAIDDMRALSMFLSGNDIRVLAITCSQGTLLPDSVFAKVSSLLSAFHHEGIPVGISKGTDTALPSWASFAKGIRWGNAADTGGVDFSGEATSILNKTIQHYPDRVTLVALGSLKTYADWLKGNPGIAAKIDRIVWSSNRNLESGFNYQLSPESYAYISQHGIKLDVVNGNAGGLPVDQDYLNMIRHTGSIYAEQIAAVHSQDAVVEKMNDGHLHLCDDMVPFYLTVPILFEVEKKDGITSASLNRTIPAEYINELIGRLLISASTTNNRVFKSFPTDTTLYKPEYAEILDQTLGEFGPVEWKAISLTNEIHGHTGIYSIIGAKMGVRAMEYFNVGINNMEVTTFAGNDPPLSCFNDGVQISTGATIGQGLITISDSINTIPTAIFEFNDRKVSISVKPEIAARMQQEIKYGVATYGSLTNPYWLYIEQLAIRYWTGFDRMKIFRIEKIS